MTSCKGDRSAMKKKLFALICILIVIACILSGCVNRSGNIGTSETDENGNVIENTEDNTDLPKKPIPPKIDFNTDPSMEGIDLNFAKDPSEMFTERDLNPEYDESKCAVVQFDGNVIKTSSKAVQISKSTAKLTEGGTYILRGTLNGGMVIVDAGKKDKVQIVLDNANIYSPDSAAIYVLNAKKVFVTLVGDNMLANCGNFKAIDANNIDAALFSKQDLTINGDGVLLVDSPAGHGIVSKDNLVIAGGAYNISAANHAIAANDSIRIARASITAKSGKDAIHAENKNDASLGYVYICDGDYNLNAAGDGISSVSDIQIYTGVFKIESGVDATADTNDIEAPSVKGIKTKGNLLVADGTINVNSPDDAISADKSVILTKGTFNVETEDKAFTAGENIYIVGAVVSVGKSKNCYCAPNVDIRGGKHLLNSKGKAVNVASKSGATDCTLNISGGEININSQKNGIEVSGSFYMSGGYVKISASATQDAVAFAYEKEAIITGGVLIATGSDLLPEIPMFEKQGIISVSVAEIQTGGIDVYVTDADGNVIVCDSLENDFKVVIISAPGIAKGSEYTVKIGELSNNFTAK